MSNETPPIEPREPEDPELGAPVLELDGLEVVPPSGFLGRLRRRIERRSLGGQVLVVSWELPRLVLLEMLRMTAELWSPSKGERK